MPESPDPNSDAPERNPVTGRHRPAGLKKVAGSGLALSAAFGAGLGLLLGKVIGRPSAGLAAGAALGAALGSAQPSSPE